MTIGRLVRRDPREVKLRDDLELVLLNGDGSYPRPDPDEIAGYKSVPGRLGWYIETIDLYAPYWCIRKTPTYKGAYERVVKAKTTKATYQLKEEDEFVRLFLDAHPFEYEGNDE